MSGPYETIEERERKEFNLSKQSWISERNFNTVFSNRDGTKFIENYVVRDPSEPPNLYKFRNFDKKRWLSGNFIV